MYWLILRILKIIWNILVNIIVVNIRLVLFDRFVNKFVRIIIIGFVGLEICVGVLLKSVVKKLIVIVLYRFVIGFKFDVILSVSVSGKVMILVVKLLVKLFCRFERLIFIIVIDFIYCE